MLSILSMPEIERNVFMDNIGIDELGNTYKPLSNITMQAKYQMTDYQEYTPQLLNALTEQDISAEDLYDIIINYYFKKKQFITNYFSFCIIICII